MQQRLDIFLARKHALLEEGEEEKRSMLPPAPLNRGGEVEMTSEGARLPERNAFEYTVYPQKKSVKAERRGGSSKDKVSGKQAI